LLLVYTVKVIVPAPLSEVVTAAAKGRVEESAAFTNEYVGVPQKFIKHLLLKLSFQLV